MFGLFSAPFSCPGHHLFLKTHYHCLRSAIDLTGPFYQLADHTLQIWGVKCPGYTFYQQLLRNHPGFLGWFATSPEDVVALTTKTLINLDAYNQHLVSR